MFLVYTRYILGYTSIYFIYLYILVYTRIYHFSYSYQKCGDSRCRRADIGSISVPISSRYTRCLESQPDPGPGWLAGLIVIAARLGKALSSAMNFNPYFPQQQRQ